MKKIRFFIMFFLSIVENIQATTIKHKAVEIEIVCRCLGTYTRFQFEILQGSPTNIKVVDSSSDEVCDEYHSQELRKWQNGLALPDGAVGIGVSGYLVDDKNMGLEECLSNKERERRGIFYIEEMDIDLKKINQPLKERRSGSVGPCPGFD